MDELDALKALFPPPDPLPAPVVQQQREKLMTFIETTTIGDHHEAARHGRWRSRGRRTAVLVAVPVVTVLLAAAGWAVFGREAREAVSFSCIADGVTSVLPNDGTSPVDACQEVWQSGGMVPGVTTAPPLVACVDGGAAVKVIEGDDTNACELAGMGAWSDQATFEAAGASVRAVLVSLHDRNLETGNGCATVQDWRSGLADQPGTRGWTIDVDQIDPARHCYEVGSVDPTIRTITLIGSPGDSSIGCDPRTGC